MEYSQRKTARQRRTETRRQNIRHTKTEPATDLGGRSKKERQADKGHKEADRISDTKTEPATDLGRRGR